MRILRPFQRLTRTFAQAGFLCGLYNRDIFKYNPINVGTYGKHRSGGPCNWFVCNYQVRDELFCVPYYTGTHLYVYTFFVESTIKSEWLYDKLLKHRGIVHRGSEREFIVVSDAKLEGFDHVSELIEDEANFSNLGGFLEYADLSPPKETWFIGGFWEVQPIIHH